MDEEARLFLVLVLFLIFVGSMWVLQTVEEVKKGEPTAEEIEEGQITFTCESLGIAGTQACEKLNECKAEPEAECELTGVEPTPETCRGPDVDISYPRSWCYINLATEANLPQLCEAIKEGKYVTTEFAKQERENCYFWAIVGNSLTNSSLCDKAANKDYCVAVTRRNLSFCDQYKNASITRIQCYYHTTLKPKYPELFETHAHTYPLRRWDAIEMCKKVQDQIEKERCELYLSPLLNPSVCTSDYCLQEIASATGNFSICEMIESEYDRDFCYRNTGIISNNFSLCEKINATYVQYLCYRNIAENTVNTSLCDISSTDDRWVDLCYANIAEATKNISFCDFTNHSTDTKIKEWCIQDVAVGTGDISLCDLITTSTQRDICYELVIESFTR